MRSDVSRHSPGYIRVPGPGRAESCLSRASGCQLWSETDSFSQCRDGASAECYIVTICETRASCDVMSPHDKVKVISVVERSVLSLRRALKATINRWRVWRKRLFYGFKLRLKYCRPIIVCIALFVEVLDYWMTWLHVPFLHASHSQAFVTFRNHKKNMTLSVML